MTAGRLDSPVRVLPAGRTLAQEVNRPVCIPIRAPTNDVMPKASFSLTTSPLGEEEPGLKGAERGGYSPIPRRDARVGEWEKKLRLPI